MQGMQGVVKGAGVLVCWSFGLLAVGSCIRTMVCLFSSWQAAAMCFWRQGCLDVLMFKRSSSNPGAVVAVQVEVGLQDGEASCGDASATTV